MTPSSTLSGPSTTSAEASEALRLSARDLVKDYGPLRAVNGVGLELEAGTFLTVFGPNGAGKTTLLGLLGGRLRPTRGEVLLGGTALDPSETAWRARIGVLSHQGMLYSHLTAEENLRFYGRLYALDDLEDRVKAGLERVGLAPRGQDFAGRLSHGMRQRLALARALLHDPDLVLLDEPYTGLDPYAAAVLRDVLASLDDGRRIVVMVTHNLKEGLELADRVAIQVRGRLAWEGRGAELRDGDFEHRYHRVVQEASA